MKRFISALLVALLLVSSFATVAFAANGVTISADDVTAEGGDTIKIPFIISGVDFAGYEMNITADEGITVEGVAFNLIADSFFNEKTLFVNGTKATNIAAEGTLITVTVKVADDIAAGTYNVGLDVGMIWNADREILDVTVDPCVITIEAEETEAPTEEPTDPPHVHAFGEWVTVKAPTCIEKGLAERTCECGEKETKELDYAPHIFSKDWTANETHHYHLCTVCKEAIADKDVHHFVDYKITVAPTETTSGKQVGHCRECNYEDVIILPALDPGEGPEPTGDISVVVNTGLTVLVITLCSVAAIVIKRKTAV